MENMVPPIYAGIIDDIGRRLYSGNNGQANRILEDPNIYFDENVLDT